MFQKEGCFIAEEVEDLFGRHTLLALASKIRDLMQLGEIDYFKHYFYPMKKLICLLAIVPFLNPNATAQIRQYTSDREISVLLHSTDIHYKDKRVGMSCV